jgi:hypothetical protein
MINLVFDDVGMMRTMAACPDTVIRSSDHVMDYGRFPIPYVFRLISESSYIARTSDAPVKAFSLDDIIKEITEAKISERGATRLDDKISEMYQMPAPHGARLVPYACVFVRIHAQIRFFLA